MERRGLPQKMKKGLIDTRIRNGYLVTVLDINVPLSIQYGEKERDFSESPHPKELIHFWPRSSIPKKYRTTKTPFHSVPFLSFPWSERDARCPPPTPTLSRLNGRVWVRVIHSMFVGLSISVAPHSYICCMYDIIVEEALPLNRVHQSKLPIT